VTEEPHDREPADDREQRERRADELRRRIEDLVRGEAGERPAPGSPREFVEEQMREERERLRPAQDEPEREANEPDDEERER
jgi:hypothetical protein